MRWCVVSQADVHDGFDIGSFADINDVGAGHVFVGDADEITVEVTDAGAAQADGFDGSVDTLQKDSVADSEGFVGEDRDGAEKVGEGILGGETDGEAAYRKGGEQAGDVHAEVLRGDQHRDDEDEDLEGLTQDGEQVHVEHAVLSGLNALLPYAHY